MSPEAWVSRPERGERKAVVWRKLLMNRMKQGWSQRVQMPGLERALPRAPLLFSWTILALFCWKILCLCKRSQPSGQKPKSKHRLLFGGLSVAIVLIRQSPFIRASLTHFISLLFCFEISRATINFREREREREFNKDLLLLSASIAVMKIYFLSLLCPI